MKRVLMTVLAGAVMSIEVRADAALECGIGRSSQVEIADCMAATEATADKAMATALEIARSVAVELDQTTGRTEVGPALDAAQAAFLDFRDKQCALVGATFGGGSGAGIAIRGCRIDLTRDRTDALMRLGR
jgi:uncharacterized protein YecT (DUF1311 family)